MSIETLEPHLLDSLQQSVRDILETMAATRPREVVAEPETTSTFHDEVIGLVRFTGTRCGTFVVRAREHVARELAARMLQLDEPCTVSCGDACDAFGEVANVLAGNFKNAWVASGHDMRLSVPDVIHHGRLNVRSDGQGGLRSRVRVHLDMGVLDIGVHLEAKH